MFKLFIHHDSITRGMVKLSHSIQDIVKIFVYYGRNEEKIIYTLVFLRLFFP
jgi:hypothetical protein